MINKIRVETPTIALAQMNLLFRLRILWREMATWIRAYLVSRVLVGKDYQDAFTRLYDIPSEFGSLMGLVFGAEIGNNYAQRLSDQIILFRDYIEALLNDNQQAATEIYYHMYMAGADRAKFLASINPFWNAEQWTNLIYKFLTLNLETIRAFLTGDYKGSINIFDTLLTHADQMGDYFTEGFYNYIASTGGTAQPAQPTQPAPTPLVYKVT